MTVWYSIENEENIPTPTLLLYPERIRQNLQQMIGWVGDANRLRPHVKTHKLPEIIAIKRQLGIRKFKTSTIAETEMTAAAGGEDILLAYQPVGPNIQRLLELMLKFPNTKFSTLVDDLATVQHIAARMSQANRVLELYVDLNIGMNRTGIMIGEASFELYQALSCCDGVRPAGLHAYDGHLHGVAKDQLSQVVADTFEPVWKFRHRLLDSGLAVPTVIAAGTPTSRLLAQNPAVSVEVGAGTTVLWDFGQQDAVALSTESTGESFEYAAVLMARVVSRPGEDLICLDLGHKSVASEMPHPRVRFFGLEDAEATTHSEEHLVLRTSKADQYPVGTVIYGVPKHVCPTVALHSHVWCVEHGRAVAQWDVVARARKITI